MHIRKYIQKTYLLIVFVEDRLMFRTLPDMVAPKNFFNYANCNNMSIR